ncbi:MAG: hypothetical protein GY756_02410 [bacterium]|nr:hypothetical protein [bacterium]
MAYWRMQLHPNDSKNAARYTKKCLSLNHIGLDLGQPRGDLTLEDYDSLEATPNNIKAFVHKISPDDYILISLHHMPFALVTEIEKYNYIKWRVEELGIWFRHFRRFGSISYYSDLYGQGKNNKITMTNTFSSLSKNTETGKLITDWIEKL